MSIYRRLTLLLPVALLSCAAAGFAHDAAATDPAQILEQAPSPMDYPHAGSVVMLDEADVVVKDDGGFSMTSHQIVKIFNLRGRGRAAVKLPYNSSYENIRVEVARTIRKDGTVTEIKPDAIVDGSLVAGRDSFKDIRVKTLSFPALEDDCIIEYQWTMKRSKPLMPGHYWEEWRSQDFDPVITSRLSLTLPAKMVPKASYHNLTVEPVVTSSEQDGTKTLVWEVKNSPALETEPLMPPFREIAAWFGVSTISSWDEVARWLSGLFEPRLRTVWDIEAVVKRLIVGKTTEEEKAKAIFYWLGSNVRHVALDPGISGFIPHSAADVYRYEYGDSMDMAVLLITMLRKAGIDAWPAFLPTSDAPVIDRSLPYPAQFAHCIVLAEVNGREVWLDPTAETTRFGDLPASDRGADAFVVKDGKGGFRKTPEYGRDENGVFFDNTMTLSDDGTLEGNVFRELRGDEAMQGRLDYKYGKPDDIKESFKKSLSYLSVGARLNGYQISDFRDNEKPLHGSYSFTAPEWANRTRKFMIFPVTFFHDEGVWTPFLKARRDYPIVYRGRHTLKVVTRIALPEGFAIEEMPDDLSLKAPFGMFNFTYRVKGGTLLMEKRMEVWPARIPATEYDAIRKVYDQVSLERKKQVVLKKTTP